MPTTLLAPLLPPCWRGLVGQSAAGPWRPAHEGGWDGRVNGVQVWAGRVTREGGGGLAGQGRLAGGQAQGRAGPTDASGRSEAAPWQFDTTQPPQPTPLGRCAHLGGSWCGCQQAHARAGALLLVLLLSHVSRQQRISWWGSQSGAGLVERARGGVDGAGVARVSQAAHWHWWSTRGIITRMLASCRLWSKLVCLLLSLPTGVCKVGSLQASSQCCVRCPLLHKKNAPRHAWRCCKEMPASKQSDSGPALSRQFQARPWATRAAHRPAACNPNTTMPARRDR